MSSRREGDRISNYLLEKRIGAGSFGEVWCARHHVFGDKVAIKMPTDSQYVRNLQREGVAIHGLNHPNIVRAIDLDPYADPPYLVMELIEGPSLRVVIDENRGTLPIRAVVTIMRGMLQALRAAHASDLVHRDIKPANILIHQPPVDLAEVLEQSVKVTDFGLGRVGGVTAQSILASGSHETEDGRSIAGTIAYMSPEQKEGKQVDARSDLYACGVVLFEMLTGERPQGGDLPSSMRQDVPRFLDEVFRRCYTHLDRRFGSAEEMLAALADRHGPPPPPPSLPKAYVTSPAGLDCPACHRSVHRDDQFCIYCGQQLVASVPRCQACEAFVQPGDRFCIACGQDLRVLSR